MIVDCGETKGISFSRKTKVLTSNYVLLNSGIFRTDCIKALVVFHDSEV
jgi:hypothetical protein